MKNIGRVARCSSPCRINATKSSVITYKGRYGLQFNVPKADVTNIIIKEVSRTHSVLQLYSGADCVGTSDILPTEACNTMKDWLGRY